MKLAGVVLALIGGFTAGCMPETELEYQYVTDGVIVPTTTQMARDLAFDVDGDGTTDNQIGVVISLLDLQLQPYVDDYVNGGELLLLHSVFASNLEDGGATWRLYLGEDVPAPDFGGTGWFPIDPESPRDAVLKGSISGRRLHVSARQMPLYFRLGAGQPMLALHPFQAHIEATMYDDGCIDGKIGGANTSWEVNEQIIPAIAHLIGTSADNLRTNTIMQNLVAPDVDLFDGEELRPNHDGVPDAVSFGLGLTCVSAAFDRPVE